MRVFVCVGVLTTDLYNNCMARQYQSYYAVISYTIVNLCNLSISH